MWPTGQRARRPAKQPTIIRLSTCASVTLRWLARVLHFLASFSLVDNNFGRRIESRHLFSPVPQESIHVEDAGPGWQSNQHQTHATSHLVSSRANDCSDYKSLQIAGPREARCSEAVLVEKLVLRLRLRHPWPPPAARPSLRRLASQGRQVQGPLATRTSPSRYSTSSTVHALPWPGDAAERPCVHVTQNASPQPWPAGA